MEIEQLAGDIDPQFPQPTCFLQKRHRIEHYAVPDHTPAVRTQNPAWHQLQNEFLAVNDDRVSGIVAAGVSGHHREALRQHIDDLPFAFIAPLGAHHHRRFRLGHPDCLLSLSFF